MVLCSARLAAGRCMCDGVRSNQRDSVGAVGVGWVGWSSATHWNVAHRGVSLNLWPSEGEILTDGAEDRRPTAPADLCGTQT